MTSQPSHSQGWKESFSDIFYRNVACPLGGQENADMGGGCGAGLLTARNNQASRQNEFSGQPLKDNFIFHQNLSNIEGKFTLGNENGRSRMVSELAVGNS